MKELAFQTTSAGEEAVGSPIIPDYIDSAVTTNSTFADQEYKCTLPLIHSQRSALVPGPTSLVDWESACMNGDDQWNSRYSVYAYWKNYIEATHPQAFLRKFHCFPKLPLELRRQIWFHALPEPCFVELDIYRESHHVPFFGGSELVAADIWRIMKTTRTDLIPSQLLLICRESHDFFLEHYSTMDLESMVGNEVISDGTNNPKHPTFHASSRGYIDNKSDTLVIRDLQDVMEQSLFFNMHLNLSVITKLSIHTSEVEYLIDPITGRSEFEGLPSHLWKHIETLFPHLKQLTFIQNTCRDDRSVHQGDLDFSPLSTNCLQPITADTIDSLLECITRGHYCEDQDKFVRELLFTGQRALNHSIAYKRQYLKRVHDNPGYWGNIEFETSLLINFYPDYDYYIINRNSPNQKDLGGNSHLLITRAESCRGTISLYFEGWMDELPIQKDEAFYNDYGVKELFEGCESTTRYDYDKWPWNDPRTIQDME